MPRKKTVGFPSPYEIETIPGTEGWQRMYPEMSILPSERRKEIEEWSIFHEQQHWPRALKPFDVECVHAPAWRGLTTFQNRIIVVPNTRGYYFWIINGYHYGADVPPYTDPKVIQERLSEFLRRMIYCWFNWKKVYGKWKRDVWKLLKEQEALADQIRDLPEPYEDRSYFEEVRGISCARKLEEVYDRAVHLYLNVFEGYQYTFIGAAYSADFNLIEFCKKVVPDVDNKTIAAMITGVELEAFRPDEEVKRLARLAFNWGLASIVKEQKTFDGMRAEFEKTGNGRKWLEEYKKSSFWFNMMVTQGVFARHDDPCWLENPDIILGFLKNYIEKIEKGEKIERDVNALKKEKKRIYNEVLAKIKDPADRATFKQYYDLANTFYEFVEEQILFVKNFAYALFRRNIRKFAEILTKHGILKEPDDIFYLKFGEIKSCMHELTASWGAGQPASQYWIREIEWRKKVFEKFEKWEPVMFCGPWKKPSIEPFTIILGGGISNEILDLYRKPVPHEKRKELKGIAAGTGVVEGVARVIKKPEEITKLRPGEIMVCPHTQPAWTPAFGIISAVVTNVGGVMSHTGICAREYGIPAVMNTYIATEVIKTGDRIKVDADNATVTILSR